MMLSALRVDWRLEFMAAHPELFRIKADDRQLSLGYPLCQAGWQDILERLCGRIEDALRADEAFEWGLPTSIARIQSKHYRGEAT
jgi:hypothetical protein